MATPSLGDAYIDVHANTDPFKKDLNEGLDKISDDAEESLDRTGKDFGETVADAMEDELGRHGKDFGKAIEKSMDGETIHVRSKINYHNVRDSKGRFARLIADEIEDAVSSVTRSGGPISRIGQAIADAVGAGFNISGKSPLIAVLIPAIAALIGVVVAAIQAVGVLGAALATLPGLLVSIGIQAGVLAIAFQGVFKAIDLAFDAKNPEELQQAIEKLTPSAQRFVLNFLSLRKAFEDIKKIVQENFFQAFGDSLFKTFDKLAPLFKGGFAQTATAMGKFFAALAAFFRSKTFVKFVNEVFPATAKWLAQLGPGLVTFLTGLFDLTNAAMPFLEDFGRILLNTLAEIGKDFSAIAADPTFTAWLDDMAVTLAATIELVFKLFDFIAVFMGTLNRAGGVTVIDTLTESFERMMFVLASPVGQKAMEALVNFAIIGIEVFGGLVIAVLLFMAGMESMAEAVGAAITWLWNHVLRPAFQAIADFFNWLLGRSKGYVSASKSAFDGLVTHVKKIGDRIVAAVNLGSRLYNAGRNIIRGLIDGIKSMLGSLWDAMAQAMNVIGGFLPGSPAKMGPLSGRGFAELRGQRLMEDLMTGLRSELPALRSTSNEIASNIVFGPNSIRMEFHGPVPSESQARGVGAAVGQSAAGILASRNTRLAVRTL